TPMRTTSSFGAAYPLMLNSCLPSPRATPLARRSGVSPVNANEGNPVATAPVPNARLWMNFLRDFMTVIFYVLQGRKKPGDVLCEPRGSTAQRLQKPNLIHRAHVVMPLITRPIVHIIIKIIREEPERLHIDHEHAGVSDVFYLCVCEFVAHEFEVAPGDSVQYVFTHLYLGKVSLLFVGGRHIRADHIAEVAYKIARHHRVEVDDANALPVLIEKNVADLRVVMGDADPEFRIFPDGFKVIHHPPMLFERFYCRMRLFNTLRISIFKGCFKLLVSKGKIMEVGNGDL